MEKFKVTGNGLNEKKLHVLKVSAVSAVSGNVKELAYSFYQKRGYTPGYELQDWLKAEKVFNDQKKKISVSF